MGQHQIGVVVPEANIAAMECAHPVVKKRRLPAEGVSKLKKFL